MSDNEAKAQALVQEAEKKLNKSCSETKEGGKTFRL